MRRQLPVFPLDVVLFPGTTLPLHIFEPRYRTLLEDCLAGDRLFGLVPPGDAGPPPTGTIGTTAMIRGTRTLSDGRSHIVVSGEDRFMIRRWLETDRPYLVALVDPFEDEEPGNQDLGTSLDQLRELGARCARALHELTEAEPVTDWSDDPARLSFQVASLLQVDREFKQRFLGIRSAAHRVVLLVEVLPGLVAELEERAAVHRGAGRNGKGGSHPDLVFDS